MCEDVLLHRTTTELIGAPGGGWEFTCQACDYRARYHQKVPQGASRLEILNIGDAKVRHISSSQPGMVGKGNSSRPRTDQAYRLNWLTPESMRWLEEMMQKLG